MKIERCLILLATVIAIGLCTLLGGCSDDSSDISPIDPPIRTSIIELKVVKTITDDQNLNYVVESNIYPEDNNNLMFLTLRGGGISVYNLSDPENPSLISHWDEEPNRIVEGQDKWFKFLIVSDITRGGFFVFDAHDPRNLIKLSYLNFEGIDSVLHNKIYQTNHRWYVLFTGGFNLTTEESSDLLVAADITDPTNPFFVSKLSTGISAIEGITIKDNYAFIGGFRSTKFSVIDVSDPANMTIVKTLDEFYYCQMVSEIGDDGVLYAALWGGSDSSFGGLAAFDISDPKNTYELSHVLSPVMYKANRVRIKGDYVFMPLEIKGGGGVAIVDRTNPEKLVHAKTVLKIPEIVRPYCLAIKEDYLYVFGSETNSMVVMQIIIGN